METKNVLVVLAGALVISLIVSLAVVGNFTGTGYAVGDTVRTQNIYERAIKPSAFTLGRVQHTINVLDISENKVAFGVDGVKEDIIIHVGEQAYAERNGIGLSITPLSVGKNFYSKAEYAVFQVTEVPVPSSSGLECDIEDTTWDNLATRECDEGFTCVSGYIFGNIFGNNKQDIMMWPYICGKGGQGIPINELKVKEKYSYVGFGDVNQINITRKDAMLVCCRVASA